MSISSYKNLKVLMAGSLLHMLVDGMCAFAMVGFLAGGRQENFFIYNFCAFALQFPLGAFLDVSKKEASENPRAVYFEYGGALLAALGLLFSVLTKGNGSRSPALAFAVSAVMLGIGNAMFHIGGGVRVIAEDRENLLSGRGLGIFVAPGAYGLYCGMCIAGGQDVLLRVAIGAAALLFFLIWFSQKYGRKGKELSETARAAEGAGPERAGAVFASLCFIVVAIRSYTGLGVVFPWKNTGLMLLLAVAGAVLGKIAGGFINARFGTFRTVTATLALSALFYVFSANAACGLLAVFLFNMTMPVTLYLLTEAYPEYPGAAFGALTLALFVGFLPVYFFGSAARVPGLFGAVFSLISLVLLIASIKRRGS